MTEAGRVHAPPSVAAGLVNQPPCTDDASDLVVYLSQDSALFTQNSHVRSRVGVRFHAMTTHEQEERVNDHGRHAAPTASATPLTDRMLALVADDPMPVGLPERVLKAVRRHAKLGNVRAHECSVEGCTRDAVVVPPPMCAEHGGLDGRVTL